MKMEKVNAEFSAEYVRDGKALVLYQAGESRYDPLKGIDFMLCHLDSVDRGDIELYAEADPVPGDEPDTWDELGTYDELKSEILKQQKPKESPPTSCIFGWMIDPQGRRESAAGASPATP